MKPILKWAGGKTQLLNEIKIRLPSFYNTYYEAFFGGGALLWSIKPTSAVINDYNKELINVYNIIKQYPDELINELKKHKNESTYFYNIRSKDRQPDKYKKLNSIKKASRIIYLNKTCYNGLFRVNAQGQLNAPFGRYKNPKICDEINIQDVSNYLNKNSVLIFNLDFEKFLTKPLENDFVYLDPPYDSIENVSSFTGYNANGFSREDQLRLKTSCDQLNMKNVKFLLSNADTPYIRDIYSEYIIEVVQAKRYINCKGEKRSSVNELLIRNYEC